jgi:hypothetical protein
VSQTIDPLLAREALMNSFEKAMEDGYLYRSRFVEEIKELILGEHVTFRYMLVTAVLALAVNENVNPLVLQKGSSMEGAYDARSLCHKVFVPFERECLASRLGGSNEPFLNKPARFKEISLANPVRGGRDKRYLQVLFLLLEQIEAMEAFDTLCDIMHTILQRGSQAVEGLLSQKGCAGDRSRLLHFVELLVQESHQGEICVLVVGSLMSMLAPLYGEGFFVRVHPANQSGASSKETSDIDVYDGVSLLYTVEVKDKAYTKADMEHAAKKVALSLFETLLFVEGPRGVFQGEQAERFAVIEEWSERGFDLAVLHLFELANTLIALAPKGYLERFLDGLILFTKTAKAKDATKKHILACARLLGWGTVLEDDVV